MRVAGDDAEADAAEEGDAGVGPPAVPVFLAELEVFLSYILIIFYALQSGGGLMAPSASCFVGAPLYFIVPPSSTCTGRCENYVKKRNVRQRQKGFRNMCATISSRWVQAAIRSDHWLQRY